MGVQGKARDIRDLNYPFKHTICKTKPHSFDLAYLEADITDYESLRFVFVYHCIVVLVRFFFCFVLNQYLCCS